MKIKIENFEWKKVVRTRVCSPSINNWLVAILKVVLNVSHFVMDGPQVLACDVRALLDPVLSHNWDGIR